MHRLSRVKAEEAASAATAADPAARVVVPADLAAAAQVARHKNKCLHRIQQKVPVDDINRDFLFCFKYADYNS